MHFSRKKKAIPEGSAKAKELPPFSPKYPKPKILLLDVASQVEKNLRGAGFNVVSGSFGKPYRVPKSDAVQPVIGKPSLPNYKEKELVIVDLASGKPNDGPVGEKLVPAGTQDWWAKCTYGVIDPRPRTMQWVENDFDRILANGGVFIIFADGPDRRKILLGSAPHGEFWRDEVIDVDNWSFLSALSEVDPHDDHGEEMKCVEESDAVQILLARHLDGGTFSCTFNPNYVAPKNWIVLARNKFEAPVAAVRRKKGEGLIFILPQIRDKSGFLVSLLTEILPELAPGLFPHVERGRWTNRPEYELPRILEFKRNKIAIQEKAKAEIARIDKAIEIERDENRWLHNLIVETDQALVEAVKKTFEVLGFKKITDVDRERDKEGKSRREDLQLHDKSPTLIVDIKGIGGTPADEDGLQAGKHASIRMREWNRTDVAGLSIVNHQRHLPPLDRQNNSPFREELVQAAEEQTIGLMTTWDLFRLVRSFQHNKWAPEDVQPLFYKTGRISIVPTHYEYLGKVAKAWTDKFGVVVENGEIIVGDTIAVEFPILFEEAEVKSIQVNDSGVERAGSGDPAGLVWSAEKPRVREGMRVFRVTRR